MIVKGTSNPVKPLKALPVIPEDHTSGVKTTQIDNKDDSDEKNFSVP